MAQEVDTPFGDEIASFLSSEYDRAGHVILPLLRDKYGIDPWSLGEFRTLRRKNQLNLYYLNSGKVEILRFVQPAGVLHKLTAVPYHEICDFIIDCADVGIDRLKSAKAHGSLGILGSALSKLLPISAQEAAQMINQLPRENIHPIAEIIAPVKEK